MNKTHLILGALTCLLASCAPATQSRQFDVMDEVLVKVDGTGRANVKISTTRMQPYSVNEIAGDQILPYERDLGAILKDRKTPVKITVYTYMQTEGNASIKIYRDGELCGTGTNEGRGSFSSTICEIPKGL